LATTENLTRTSKRQNTYKHKLMEHKKWPNKQQKTLKKTYDKRGDRQILI